MTVIAASRYRNGLKAEVSLTEPIRCAEDKSDFVWIGLLDPTEDELRTLQKNFHLHPLAVEDALKAHQLPKLDVYGDQLFVVMRTAHLLDERIEYGNRRHVAAAAGSLQGERAVRCAPASSHAEPK